MASSYPLPLPQPCSGVSAVAAAAAPCAPRATYSLHYEEDALGIAKRVEFEARSAAYALEIAVAEADGRQALLLEDGRPLCRLIKALPGEAPYWIVADGPESMAASPRPIFKERNR